MKQLPKIIAITLLIVVISYISFCYGQKSSQSPITFPISPVSTPTTQVTPTTAIVTTSEPSKVITKSNIEDIKFTLPDSWQSQYRDGGLFISPKDNAGYYFIKMYDYPANIGRREYFCQINQYCIEGTTYFNEITVGNLSGYIARALDNSGGGSIIFATKNSNFYVIESFSSPSASEFSQHGQQFINSLIF